MTLKIFIEATRPNTLFLAVAAMLCGNALAWWFAGQINPWVAVFSLTTALGLQVVSNLANDYGDGVKGVDDARTGPRRTLASGLLSRSQLYVLILLAVAFTLVSGLLLLWVSGISARALYTFLGLGVLALVAAFAYTVGKYPYGYYALGELSVLVFFGLVGVGGTFYLQVHKLPSEVLLPAFGCGLLCAAVLNTNNMRDRLSDRAAGKTTIAVLLGEHRAHHFHLGLLVLAYLGYLVFAVFCAPQALVVLLLLLFAWRHVKRILQANTAQDYAPELKVLVQHTLFVNVLFAFGLVIAYG